jgi:prepilin-type processing-associated H-X9-DG protein
MSPSKIARYLIVICILTAIPCFADTLNLPLTDKVPDDALIYIGWAGTDSLHQSYDASHLKAVLAASNFADVISQLIPQLASKSSDPAAKDNVALLEQTAITILKYPTTFYLREISQAGAAEPQFRPALVCDAASDSPLLLDILRKMAADGKDPNVTVGSAGTLIWISAAGEQPDQVTQTLAASPAFTSVMNRLQPSPAFATYINIQSSLAKINAMAAHDRDAGRIWPHVRDALGLTHLTAYAATAGFDGADWMTASCLLAPSPRTGLLAAIEPAPADPALLARIPDSANLVNISNFDAGKFFDTIEAAFTADPRANTTFHQISGAASMFLGRNLRRQILGPLGPQWVVYSTDPTNFIVMTKPTDPAAASDGLVSAIYGICNAINARFAPRTNPNAPNIPDKTLVTVDQKSIQGITVTTATAAGFAPSMAINNGILYFGISPFAVAQAASAPDATDINITHRPGFADAAKRLNAPTITGFNYVNLPKTAPAVYAVMAVGLNALHQLGESNGIHVPPLSLPPLDLLQANLSPALRATWADADGIYNKSISPFPAATVLGNSPDQLTSVGTVALATSILLPSLNRARETANRVKCASNERQIGQAILLYSNENKGAYPPDLGTLIKTEDITAQVFICPSGNTNVPAKLNTPDETAKWVNNNSDYIYVGKGMTMSTAKPTDIVLYEKPDSHNKDGMNFLYGDGHVEFQRMDMAKKLIEQQTNGGGNGNGEQGL